MFNRGHHSEQRLTPGGRKIINPVMSVCFCGQVILRQRPKIADEASENSQTNPDNFSILVIEQLRLHEEKEIRITRKKKT